MILDRQPENYLPVTQPIQYCLALCDPGQPVDVQIIDARTSHTIGIKRLGGSSGYTFNIEGYLRKRMAFIPEAHPYPEFVDRSARTAQARIAAGSLASATITATAALEQVKPHALLSKGPAVRKIARDEYDELCFIASGDALSLRYTFSGPGGTAVVEGTPYMPARQMIGVPVNLPRLAVYLEQGANLSDFDALEVCVSAGSNTILTQKYAIGEENPQAVRIAWVNAMGAVDFYSFPAVVQEKITAERSDGLLDGIRRHTYDVQAESTVTLASDFEPARTLRWLAEILHAPKVWAVRGNTYTAIEALPGETIVQGAGPQRFRFSYRSTGIDKYRCIL